MTELTNLGQSETWPDSAKRALADQIHKDGAAISDVYAERNRLIEVGEELAHAAWEAYLEGTPDLLDEFEKKHAAWERLMQPYRHTLRGQSVSSPQNPSASQ
jgi:hypothetical protein